MSPIYIHRYRLVLRSGSANALSLRREVAGFLFRAFGGYGCVHPWPELGDPEVEELLAMLCSGYLHRLLKRALFCAAKDGTARREGRSLFIKDAAIPRSHATITGEADFPALAAAGFTTVKLKTHGADPGIAERVRLAVEAGLRVRIDCNGTGISALRALRPFAEYVNFIEDPEPYNAARWREIREELGLPLALDRLESADAGGYDIRVLKPALESCEPRTVPVVFTSYMDHPLGQMFAASEASRYAGAQSEAGLLTHHLFESDAFTEAVRSAGPQLLPPGGTGLGFDELLEALEWRVLECGSPLPLSEGRSRGAEQGGVLSLRKALTPAPHRPLRGSPKAAEGCRTPNAGLFLNPRTPLAGPPPEFPGGFLVFQTSGSTGAPSLVCLTPEAMTANAAAVNAWVQATSTDVWLRMLPEFHVGGMSIHFRAALTNSRVVVDEEKWDTQRCVSQIQENRVTFTSLVPAQVFDLVAAGLRAPASLRAVFVGGGRLEDALYTQALALGWPVLPSFGMTETSSQVATAKPGGDESLELLPCWEARVDDAGRLQLRGAPLLSGRFVRNPQTPGGWEFQRAVDDDGWFTTADRVTLEGRILIPLGRTDRVVKVLGELVDLDAIEAALRRAGLPPERGVVVAREDARAGVRPWLISDFDGAETIMAAVNETLPPFARIAGAVAAKLPRSPLGKILRGQLDQKIRP